jgi:hypothetical protein
MASGCFRFLVFVRFSVSFIFGFVVKKGTNIRLIQPKIRFSCGRPRSFSVEDL